MTPDARSRKSLWRKLNLLEDWLATGFSRPHPDLEIDESAPAPAPAVEGPGPAPGLPVQSPLAWDERSGGADRPGALAAVAAEVSACVKCGLSAARTATVPGEGSLDAPVMFVGEGPGAEEDRTGRPFVGAAGRYLDKWLSSINLDRARCYIANCVKCRPPQNREPHPEEIGACLPYLERQIAAVRPRLICCLGRIAAQTLLGTTSSLGSLRGKIHQRGGIPVIVTYHPSAVLRDQSLRKPVWDDLKVVQKMLQSG